MKTQEYSGVDILIHISSSLDLLPYEDDLFQSLAACTCGWKVSDNVGEVCLNFCLQMQGLAFLSEQTAFV